MAGAVAFKRVILKKGFQSFFTIPNDLLSFFKIYSAAASDCCV